MAIPFISEILDFFHSWLDKVPKPIQIMFVILLSGFILGYAVPFVYQQFSSYDCNDDLIVYKDLQCEKVLDAYNLNCNNNSINIFDSFVGWVNNYDEIQLTDDKGNVFDSTEMCIKTSAYWSNIYCDTYIPTKEDIFYPLCEDGKLKPSIFGNNIFDYRVFLTLIMFMYLIYFLFFIFGNN